MTTITRAELSGKNFINTYVKDSPDQIVTIEGINIPLIYAYILSGSEYIFNKSTYYKTYEDITELLNICKKKASEIKDPKKLINTYNFLEIIKHLYPDPETNSTFNIINRLDMFQDIFIELVPNMVTIVNNETDKKVPYIHIVNTDELVLYSITLLMNTLCNTETIVSTFALKCRLHYSMNKHIHKGVETKEDKEAKEKILKLIIKSYPKFNKENEEIFLYFFHYVNIPSYGIFSSVMLYLLNQLSSEGDMTTYTYLLSKMA